ncbi:NIC-domain-containing protein, partial [Atractiella rhizophila]
MDKNMMDSLVNSSKRMAELLGSSSGGGGGDLPPLRLGLEAVEAESRRLLSRAQPQKQNDTKAYAAFFTVSPGSNASFSAFLLAGVGVNVDELMRDVTDVNLVNTFEPLKPIHDTDIEGYLQHEHEQHIISAIEEGRRQTAQDFYKQMNNSVHASWAKQRARIFEDLLVHNPALSQHMNEDTHAGILKDSAGLPASRSAASFGLLMSSRRERQKSVAIQRLWQIVGKQVGEREVANGEFQRETVTERQYAQIYCMEVDSPAWSHLQQQIAQGSRAFLEDQFLQHMEREIMSRPVEAGLGGVPTIENKVRAYLNIKFQKESAAGLEMINNVPIWARLFYLLRAGHAQEAVNYAIDPSNQLESLERNFGTYFKA